MRFVSKDETQLMNNEIYSVEFKSYTNVRFYSKTSVSYLMEDLIE